jgi:hypothetical protein
MAGGSACESLLSFAPHAIQPGPIAAVLHQLLPWIDQCLACDPALPERLGADDVVLRQVAALLDPTLLHERPGDGERPGGPQQRLQALAPIRLPAEARYPTPMAWIRAQRLERALERLRAGGPGVTVKTVA